MEGEEVPGWNSQGCEQATGPSRLERPGRRPQRECSRRRIAGEQMEAMTAGAATTRRTVELAFKVSDRLSITGLSAESVFHVPQDKVAMLGQRRGLMAGGADTRG